MTRPMIPIAGPWITPLEIQYVTDAVTNAWYVDANIYVAKFEEEFAAFVGRRHAIALPSCTSALHLALVSLNIGPGDEVIVPDITWIASAAPISYVGATPVFADVDPVSWCVTRDSIERVINERTKAVIAVDLYGNMPDFFPIVELLEARKIYLIEDAAQAAGASYRDQRAGSFGAVGVFSFHGSKTLTTGEGGMLVTDSDEIRDRCLFLRDHGRHPGDKTFRSGEVAYKYRMSNLQAALGLAQLQRIDDLIAKKREIFGWYRSLLGSRPGVTLNSEAEGTHNVYWMVTATTKSPQRPIDKWELIRSLNDRGVDSRPFFDPLSSIPAYENKNEAVQAARVNRIAYEIAPYGINLPSALSLFEADVEVTVAAYLDILEGK